MRLVIRFGFFMCQLFLKYINDIFKSVTNGYLWTSYIVLNFLLLTIPYVVVTVDIKRNPPCLRQEAVCNFNHGYCCLQTHHSALSYLRCHSKRPIAEEDIISLHYCTACAIFRQLSSHPSCYIIRPEQSIKIDIGKLFDTSIFIYNNKVNAINFIGQSIK